MSLDNPVRLESWRAVLVFCLVAVGLQILVGGIRAVDGTALAMAAKDGFAAEIPAFAQYIFDSPLKILFLKVLGVQSPAGIAVIFMVLAFLPFTAALLAADEESRKTCLLAVAALPVTHVAFSTIGSGDSVILACAVAIIVSPSRWVVLAGSTIMVTWHMQQGVIVLVMMAAAFFLSGDEAARRKLAYMVAGGVLGFAIYMAFRLWVIPPYHGRAGFLAHYVERFALRLVFYWPIAVLVAVPGLIAFWLARGLRGIHWLVWLSLLGALVVAGITSDVSRVFFVLIFGVTLFLMLSPPARNLRRLDLLVPVLALSTVVPLLNFAGIEIYSWNALAELAMKYSGASELLRRFIELRSAF